MTWYRRISPDAVAADVLQAADEAYRLAAELWRLKDRPRVVWLAKCDPPGEGDDRREFVEGSADLRGRYHPFGRPPFQGEVLVVAETTAAEAVLTIGHELAHARQVAKGELPAFRVEIPPAVLSEAEADAEAGGRVIAGHMRRGLRATPERPAPEPTAGHAAIARRIEAKLDRIARMIGE